MSNTSFDKALELIQELVSKVNKSSARMDAMEARHTEARRSDSAASDARSNARDREAFGQAQSRADDAMQEFGLRARGPSSDETLRDYRRGLLKSVQSRLPSSHKWRNVSFAGMQEEALQVAEEQIYADAAMAAASVEGMEPGAIREVVTVDPITNLRTSRFFGPQSFVVAMGRPGRHAIIRDPRDFAERSDASRAPMPFMGVRR